MVKCTTKRTEVLSTPFGDVASLNSESGSGIIQVVGVEEGVVCDPPPAKKEVRGGCCPPDVLLGCTWLMTSEPL